MGKNKKDVIKLLERIAIYMELKGENPFKTAAYRRAAQALERDERSIADIDDFTKIKGLGKGTNAVIVEYIETGRSETLLALEEQVPSGLIPLLEVPGLGGKKIAKLYQELGITDAAALEAAIENKQVETLPGFGKKSAEKILSALQEAGSRPERLPIALMLEVAEGVEAYLSTIPQIIRFQRAGSLRRMRETVRDIDFIIASDQPLKVRDALLAMGNIKEVIAQGETKVSVTVEEKYDINIDFRITEPGAFASTLHHFTGSKDHNVAMRQLAKTRGEKINEYGVEVEATGEILTFENESDFFSHFGLDYIPPEVRESGMETKTNPDSKTLVDASDIRGDLHMHTTWSDGGQSVEEMVNHARDIGYEYIAITDHSKFLQVANGLDETRLRRQREEIDRLNDKYKDIHIFSGVEMDILPNGKLDFPDTFLKEMDFVIGAIHSAFQQSEEEIMNRLCHAMENPYVSLIAHPTGRIIGRREGYAANVEKLIAKAAETGTALEINANPNRLDLSAYWAERAQEAGVSVAINTDAHDYRMMQHIKYGVATAKKGWLAKETVINTWPLEKLVNFMQRNK